LITHQRKLLDEGNIGDKHQSHLLKGNGKENHKERGWFDTHIHKPGCHNQKHKGKKYAPHHN